MEGLKQIYLQVPNSPARLIDASEEGGHHFQFDETTEPGLYEWRKTAAGPAIALTNVQYPAAEAELTYHDAASIFASSRAW